MTYYNIQTVGGHVEVYDGRGRFVLSADTRQEAEQAIRELAA